MPLTELSVACPKRQPSPAGPHSTRGYEGIKTISIVTYSDMERTQNPASSSFCPFEKSLSCLFLLCFTFLFSLWVIVYCLVYKVHCGTTKQRRLVCHGQDKSQRWEHLFPGREGSGNSHMFIKKPIPASPLVSHTHVRQNKVRAGQPAPHPSLRSIYTTSLSFSEVRQG